MYTFRPYTPDDVSFIHSSWEKSYYDMAGYRRFLFPKEFYDRHRVVRNAFFKRPTSRVIVCVAKDNPSVIIGWAALEQEKSWRYTILHYVYVKAAFKGFKLASQLVDELKEPNTILHTHLTDKADRILYKKKDPRFHFAPHLT